MALFAPKALGRVQGRHADHLWRFDLEAVTELIPSALSAWTSGSAGLCCQRQRDIHARAEFVHEVFAHQYVERV